MKKLTAVVLSLIMALSLCIPAMATDVATSAPASEVQAEELPDGCDNHPSILSKLMVLELLFQMSDKIDFDKELTALYEQLQELDEGEDVIQLSPYSMYAIMCYVLNNREDRYSVLKAGEEVASYWIYESPNGFALCLYLKKNGNMLFSICSDDYPMVRAELEHF